MSSNLTQSGKQLLTDISLTEVKHDSVSNNDVAIKNISDDVKISFEKGISEGTLSGRSKISEKDSAQMTFPGRLVAKIDGFLIPAVLGNFSVTTKSYFYNATRWVGHIISIAGDSFTAKLQDLSAADTYEIAEFNIKEVPQDDLEYVNIGNVFYWGIGYSVNNGTVSKSSVIKFQRLPLLDGIELENKVKSLDNAFDRADDLLNSITWD